MQLPLYALVRLTQPWFPGQMVGVGYRAVFDDYSWFVARPNAQKSVAKPADTNRLWIWLKRTGESCLLSWGLLAACVHIPLNPLFHEKKEKKITTSQVLGECLVIYTG